MDRSPAGERELVAVADVNFIDDFSGLRFTVGSGDAREVFDVQSKYECDRVLYQFASQLLASPVECPGGSDVLEVAIEKGVVTRINVMRMRDGVVEKSMRITHKDGVVCLVIPSPWQRVALRSLGVEDGRLVCESEENGGASYELALPGAVERLLSRLLEVGFG